MKDYNTAKKIGFISKLKKQCDSFHEMFVSFSTRYLSPYDRQRSKKRFSHWQGRVLVIDEDKHAVHPPQCRI